MTKAEALKALSGKLVFGNENQIKARKFLEAVEIAWEALENCYECRGKGHKDCLDCGGDGIKDCYGCGGTGAGEICVCIKGFSWEVIEEVWNEARD